MFALVLFIKGLTLGFAVAAPVGPIGLLCIRRSLLLGSKHGLMTGLGAATADAFYGVIAAFGFTLISSALIGNDVAIRAVGGVFLGYLGAKTFFATAYNESAEQSSDSLVRSYLSALFLTVTNPLTILSFAAAFAGLGLQSAGNRPLASAAMVGGVFVGSAFWWLFLSSATAMMKKAISRDTMVYINRGSGILLIGFAIIALLKIRI